MQPNEKKVLGLTIGSHSLVHFFEGVLPPLFPLLLAEFATDYFHLGVIVSVFSYAFGFGSLPAGLLADKIGSRRLISIYLFGAGLLAVLVWPANSLWFYGAVMGGVGLFCAIYHPAANTLLSLAMTDKGNAFGLHGVAGSFGVAITPDIVGLAWHANGMADTPCDFRADGDFIRPLLAFDPRAPPPPKRARHRCEH